SVQNCIPTQSAGTMTSQMAIAPALQRGSAALDALRPILIARCYADL
ncbi:Unknown protein sequence, partial [Pseudomonas syringae pv. spinaceae]